MDPNVALERIRALVSKLADDEELQDHPECMELVELVDGLDDWLSKKGFKPKAWR